MKHHAFGRFVITPKPSQSTSVLDGAPDRIGFTAHAAKFFNTCVPVDDVTASEADRYVTRMAHVQASEQGCQTRERRRAMLVSRN